MAALLGMGLGGCSAGQVTRTADSQPAIVGVNAASEDEVILVRDAAIAFPGPDGYPAGGSAPITMVIVNQGFEPVRLVRAQSDLGQAVLREGWVTEIPASPTPEASPAAPAATAEADAPGATPSAEAAPSAEASPTPTASPAAAQTPAPEAAPDFTIPAEGYIQVTVIVDQLGQPVGPVDAIPLQLVFDKGTVGPFNVPIATPLEPLPRAS